MQRLKKAIGSDFYLEAIFIEYAVMEDRLESIIRHSGQWNYKDGSYVSIEIKIKKVAKIAEEKRSVAHRYFTPELTDAITEWKERRNKLIHALMKQQLSTEELRNVAEDGYSLVKKLCSKSTSYKRKLASLV